MTGYETGKTQAIVALVLMLIGLEIHTQSPHRMIFSHEVSGKSRLDNIAIKNIFVSCATFLTLIHGMYLTHAGIHQAPESLFNSCR